MSYRPKSKTIWILFNPRSEGARNYVWWFDLLSDAKDHREWLARHPPGTLRTSRPFKFEAQPEGTGQACWLLFDLSNGHALSKRYCWWFNTLEEAQAHLKTQRALPRGAPLSEPVRFVRAATTRH